jgi:transcriptional regulator with XRE-family HTH domain
VLDIGRTIRRLRRARDLTQTQLAGRARIHPQQLSLIERGLRPTSGTIGRLALALGVDAGELLRCSASGDWPVVPAAADVEAGDGGR